ncbi:hypothetical protein C6N75_10210 [Streptomyces solincola]|uniref:SUKH-4 immunity protein n=1 Tax=Streptomyces solincola TaxID=2100817 RepID=A0A2S9PXZ7_9ACTN|nr:SUKH-4 family immunity protein [Streptomyces solincola]PRH79294.1 hypothetical protein C6N75_10210 [Streptomyces solincola]
MLFDVDHDTLVRVMGAENVHRISLDAAREYGFAGETLRFVMDVGIPGSEEWELSFGLPPEFDAGFVWDSAPYVEKGWAYPEEVGSVVRLGTFPINELVIHPGTGVVYQHTDAIRKIIPVHADLSSFAKTISSFLEYVENYARGEDEDDEDIEYARRKREVDALTAEIRLTDPLPFRHELSEWIEIFENLEGGIYT